MTKLSGKIKVACSLRGEVMAAKPHHQHLRDGTIADPAWAFGADPALALTEGETRALSYVLSVVAAEADRMRDANPENWVKHSEAIDSLVKAFDCKEGDAETVVLASRRGRRGAVSRRRY